MRVRPGEIADQFRGESGASAAHRDDGAKTKVRLRGVRRVYIHSEFIKLDALLKFASVAMTGGEAKFIVQGGGVSVGGELCLQRGRKIRHGDVVSVAGGGVLVVTQTL